MFPNIKDIVSVDPDKPFLHYAVVYNGLLQATNNRLAYYSSVEILTPDPKQRDILEKKIFSPDDLKLLSDEKLTLVEYRSDGFKAYFDDKDSIYRPWCGKIDNNREIWLYDDLLEDFYQPTINFKKFPDLTTVVPALAKNGSIDPRQVQTRNTHFRGVGISPDVLVLAQKAFMQTDNDFVRLEFFHADKTKEKVNVVTAAILVTPDRSKIRLYNQAVLVVPVVNKKDADL